MTTADNQPLGQALAENQAFLQTMFGGSSDFYTKSRSSFRQRTKVQALRS